MKFTLCCEQPETGRRARFFYDNLTSELLREDGTPVVAHTNVDATPAAHPAFAVSKSTPGAKGRVRTLKIQLGLGCNFSCEYCNQRSSLPDAPIAAPRTDQVDRFLSGLASWFDGGEDGQGTGCRIEFWGGEPLVYWKSLKPLAEAMRARFPLAVFTMITNGSLLDVNINAWLDRLGFHVSISHDGPGQAIRGPDPLNNPKSREAIRDLYQRLHPQGRFSFNAMVHRGNPSRASINQFFVELTEDPSVVIGEGSVIDPYDVGGLRHSFQSDQDSLAFRRSAFADIRHGRACNFVVVNQRLTDIVNSISHRRHAGLLGQKCGMDRSDAIAVDLNGNALTCQNVTSKSTAPNGGSHGIGHVSDFKGIRLTTATHWSHRQDCTNCPVLQSCKGSCMFLEGPLWDAACDNAFADHLPFFAAAIEHITGYMPFFIDGPQRASRRDIFGLIADANQAAQSVSTGIEGATAA
jgi:uncharacterized protein